MQNKIVRAVRKLGNTIAFDQIGCGEEWQTLKTAALAQQTNNSAMDAIAVLQKRFSGDYEKFSDFDNISLVVDTLAKLQQHQ